MLTFEPVGQRVPSDSYVVKYQCFGKLMLEIVRETLM